MSKYSSLYVLIAALLFCCLTAMPAPVQAADAPPNVLVILADDK